MSSDLVMLKVRRDRLRGELQQWKREPPKDRDVDTTSVIMLSFLVGMFVGGVPTCLLIDQEREDPLGAQADPLVYEARGAVISSTDPALLAQPVHVRVDPSGERCRYLVELPERSFTGEVRCQGLSIDTCPGQEGSCYEEVMRAEGLTAEGFVRIDEDTGALELRWKLAGEDQQLRGVLRRGGGLTSE